MTIIKNRFKQDRSEKNRSKKVGIFGILLSTFAIHFTINEFAYALPSCSSACLNGICNRISLFSFPVDNIAYNMDFEVLALGKKRCYDRTCYLPYIAGDDEKCYQQRHKQYGLWVEGFAARIGQSAQDNFSGYDGSGTGWVIGLERNFDHKLKLGFGYAYSHENLNASDALSNNFEIQSYQAIVYGRYRMCDLYYSLIGSFALNYYDQSQTLSDLLFDPSNTFTGWQFNGKMEIGYDFCRAYCARNFHIAPHVLATYAHLRTHAYQMPDGLNVQNEPLEDTQLGVGLLLAYDGPMQSYCWDNKYLFSGSYKPYLRLASLRTIQDEEQKTWSSYTSVEETPGCFSRGATPSSYTHIVGLGVAFDFKDNNYLSFEYDFEMKYGFHMHAAYIKYKIEWC